MSDRISEITAEAPDKRDEMALLIERDMIRSQMSNAKGRRFVWAILSQSAPMMNPVGPTDSWTNFNIGKQDIGRWLYTLIECHCPEYYPLMVEEAKEDSNHDNRNTESKPG